MACTSNHHPELLSLSHFITSPSDNTIFKGLSPYSLSTAAKYELEKLGQGENTNSNDYTHSTDILEELSLTDDLKRSLVDACQVLKKLKNGNSYVYREAITTIKELRRLAVEQFSTGKISEALILAHQSLALGRQYHNSLENVMLSSEMSTELYIISYCFIRAGKLENGIPFLKELRYLVEMTIRGDGKIAKDKLPHLTYLLAKLYTAYDDQQTSNLFFYKYIELIRLQVQDKNDESKIELCDAIQRVCVEMVSSRQYDKALELANEVLNMRIAVYGDFKSKNPTVADAYCNLGLLYRLTGNPVDGLHKLICGLDMHMRIHNNRNHPKVQNALLSIACCYHVMGDSTSACSLYNEVFSTRRLTFGVNHPATKNVQKLLNKCNLTNTTSPTHDGLTLDKNLAHDSHSRDKNLARDKTQTRLVADKLRNIIFKPEADYSFKTPYKGYPAVQTTNKLIPSYYSVCTQYYDKYPPNKPITINGIKILPFINVPHISCGQATLDGSGEPLMELSNESEDLLKSWGIFNVNVSYNGDVNTPTLNNPYNELKIALPFVNNGNTVLGYHGKCLYLPNPAIAHLKDFKIQPIEPSVNGSRQKPTSLEKSSSVNANTSRANTSSVNASSLEKSSSVNTIPKIIVQETCEPADKATAPQLDQASQDENSSNAEAKTAKQRPGVAMSILKKISRSFSRTDTANQPTNSASRKDPADDSTTTKEDITKDENEKKEDVPKEDVPKEDVPDEPQPDELDKSPLEPKKKLKSYLPLPKNEDMSLEDKLGSFSAKIGSLAELLKSNKVPPPGFKSAVVKRDPIHLTALPTVSVNSDILKIDSLKDKIPLETACRVYAISAIPKSGNALTAGSYLLDKDLNPIVQVPWQIDLNMLRMTTRVVKKTSMIESDAVPSNDAVRLMYAKAMEGDGLRELGFGKPLTPYHQEEIDFGGVLNIPETAIKKFVPKPQSPRLGVTKAKKAPVGPKTKGKTPSKAPPKSMPPVSTKKPTSTGPFKDTGKNKRFFWDPIFGDDAKGTMFEDMNFDQIQIDKSTVEDTFAKAAPKEKAVVPKQTIIQLLPNPKRSYNMNIALSKFGNYTFHDMRQAIINLDVEILNAEATETILNFVPTSEELSIMKEYVDSGGDLTRVDRPEQFVAAMIGIPLLHSRLDAHYVALCFRERYEEIMTPINNLSEACDTVINSKRLKTFSVAILRIGNTINEGDPKKGNATGFKATTFNKLVEFKTTTKPIRTLLRYIIDYIVTYDEDTVDNLYNEMLICEKAIRVDVPTVEGNIGKLVASFNKIQMAVSEAKKLDDPLADIMKDFVEQVETRISALNDNFKEVMDHFRELSGYLGYSDKELKKLTPEEVFTTLWNFAKNVESTRKTRKDEIERQARKEAAELKRKTQTQQTQVKTTPAKQKYTKAQPKILANNLDYTLKKI